MTEALSMVDGVSDDRVWLVHLIILQILSTILCRLSHDVLYRPSISAKTIGGDATVVVGGRAVPR